ILLFSCASGSLIGSCMFLIIVEVLSISLSSSLVGLYSSMHSSDVLLSTSVVLVSLSFPSSSYSAIFSFNELKALSTTLSHFNFFLIFDIFCHPWIYNGEAFYAAFFHVPLFYDII